MPDVTGKFDIRAVTFMHHEGYCDNVGTTGERWEELWDVMDPVGRTIAYFVTDEMAELFCDLMNAQARKMGLLKGE